MQFSIGHHSDPHSPLACVGPTRLGAVHAGGGLIVLVASTWRARRRGLAGLDALPREHALLLHPCRSVHTVGMRCALDLLWLDAAGGLVRADRHVAPWRVRSCLRARAVIECAAGEGERFAHAVSGARPAIAELVEALARSRSGALEPRDTRELED